jgi:hypothetical protein
MSPEVYIFTRFPAANVFPFHFSANNTGIHTCIYSILNYCRVALGDAATFWLYTKMGKNTHIVHNSERAVEGSVCKKLLIDLKTAVVIVVSTY